MSSVVLVPFWYEHSLPESFYLIKLITNPWDIVTLNGGGVNVVLPGISEVTPTNSMKLDRKEAPGKHFSVLTDYGYKPIDLVIVETLWSPQQWIDFQLYVMPLMRPPPGANYPKQPKVLSVQHPSTAVHGIDMIMIETITGPKKSSIKGAREFQLKCSQWEGPIKTTATNTPKGQPLKHHATAADAADPSKVQTPANPNPFFARP